MRLITFAVAALLVTVACTTSPADTPSPTATAPVVTLTPSPTTTAPEATPISTPDATATLAAYAEAVCYHPDFPTDDEWPILTIAWETVGEAFSELQAVRARIAALVPPPMLGGFHGYVLDALDDELYGLSRRPGDEPIPDVDHHVVRMGAGFWYRVDLENELNWLANNPDTKESGAVLIEHGCAPFPYGADMPASTSLATPQATPTRAFAAPPRGVPSWSSTIVVGDGRSRARLQASFGGYFAITVPDGVAVVVSAPHCMPNPACGFFYLADEFLLLMATVLHVPTGSALVIGLELLRNPDNPDATIEGGWEVARIVTLPEGSAEAHNVHVVFDAIMASLERAQERTQPTY